jgi:hypothetical protein
MTDTKHLQYWAALTAFSAVSLSSLTSSDDKDWVREQKWAISVASITLILGLFSFCMSIFKREMFVGTHMEHIAIVLVLGMWCAGLPNILNFDSDLAVDGVGNIVNVNLFFTSWAAFVAALVLFADKIPKVLLGERGDSAFTSRWLGMGTASFIVMTNAVQFWRDMCDDTGSAVCKRDVFAFILGAVCGLFSILFMVFHHEMAEQCMSVLFFIAWCLGIAYFTCVDEGPAKSSGTFYFSTWAAFLFSLNMAVVSVMSAYDKMMANRNEANNDQADNVTPGDASNKENAGQEETDKHDVEEEHEKEETDNVGKTETA